MSPAGSGHPGELLDPRTADTEQLCRRSVNLHSGHGFDLVLCSLGERELTRIVPFEMVDEVLAATGTVQRRVRQVPARVTVYLLLAGALFAELGYRQVFDRLCAGLAGLGCVRQRVTTGPSASGGRTVEGTVRPGPRPGGHDSGRDAVARAAGGGGRQDAAGAGHPGESRRVLQTAVQQRGWPGAIRRSG
ncbi:transposase domain-containing protein [Streptomyces sp. NPDC048211]|uniref:transposase domain-containing protein n=1 Tax=Streptomyces sp. NPDC048211 TaxID=3365516 RepID=UPI00371BCF6F